MPKFKLFAMLGVPGEVLLWRGFYFFCDHQILLKPRAKTTRPIFTLFDL